MSEIIEITVIDREGRDHVLETPVDMGLNLMEVCRSHDLSIEGICGGMALCASCHVYILSDHELEEPTEDEEDMLDQAFFVEDNSRLSCQIKMDKEKDGLKVQLAPVGE